jgi:hypothetical protein
MMKLSLRFITLLLLVLVLMVAPTLAHEHRHVGDFEITFGWRVEPAFAGMMNGPEIYLALASEGHDETSSGHGEEEGDHEEGEEHEHADEAMIDFATLEVNLQAEVTFGDQSTTVIFRPAWGETGHYIAELLPTLPGDYTFHVTGTIGDLEVDEIFSSADGNFSTIEPPTDVMFPAIPVVDNARIEALEARIAELEAKLAELSGE